MAWSVFGLLLVVMGISVSGALVQTSFAQTIDSDQVSITDDIANNPLAQEILQKIEQTKKLIAELEQKKFDENKAKAHLEAMRDESINRLGQDLAEWERLWEKFSAENSFGNFVSKKPSYVQGVFWDQFEFHQQKVNAGRVAMIQVLNGGGTMDAAKEAYHNAASTQRIELIEINAQSNIRHNLASYEEQLLFNSTGQVHMSPATYAKMNGLYSDYRENPNYMLANPNEATKQDTNGESIECGEGFIKVLRITSGKYSCADEPTVQKLINMGAHGIVIADSAYAMSQNIETNPATKCDSGYAVIYNNADAEYQCVLESVASSMVDNNTGQIHTLVDYIKNKDKKRATDDAIYDVNQRVLSINQDYEYDKKSLESKYDNLVKEQNQIAKQHTREAVEDYLADTSVTKEEVDKKISQIRDELEIATQKILDEKLDALNVLEAQLKDNLLKAVKGFEGNSAIHVDWDYLVESAQSTLDVKEPEKIQNEIVKISENVYDNLKLENIGITNSFGQSFDEIKVGQVLQVAADVTNVVDSVEDFTYVVEIKDYLGTVVQPAQWVAGELGPDQTLNVSLSWMPEETGKYIASVYAGNQADSAFQIADIDIDVNPEKNVSDGNYCVDGYELLFKYSDNSPICVNPDTALKLLKIGLAFD